MDLIIVVLRWIHVVGGTLWVGSMTFTAFALGPAIDDAGPGAGAIMPALQRRGVMTVLPLLGLATILSGLWLLWMVAGGDLAGFVATPTGMALALGGLAALLAYLIGMLVARPSMMAAAAILQSLGSAPAGERDSRLAEATRLRTRGLKAGRLVATLLILATTGMAVARYL